MDFFFIIPLCFLILLKDGQTALHLAAENNSDKAVELLIKNGARINYKDYVSIYL